MCVCVCVYVFAGVFVHQCGETLTPTAQHSLHWQHLTNTCSWNITHASLFPCRYMSLYGAVSVLGYLMFCNQFKWISNHTYMSLQRSEWFQCVHAGLRCSCDRGCSLVKFTITAPSPRPRLQTRAFNLSSLISGWLSDRRSRIPGLSLPACNSITAN